MFTHLTKNMSIVVVSVLLSGCCFRSPQQVLLSRSAEKILRRVDDTELAELRALAEQGDTDAMQTIVHEYYQRDAIGPAQEWQKRLARARSRN